MFIRVETTLNSPRRSVQLVEGIRSGGKVSQRIARHLGHRVALQKKRRLSPEAIRDALLHRQRSVLCHTDTGETYVIPSPVTAEAQLIYEALGLPLSEIPYPLI